MYNAVRRRLARIARLDNDGHASLRLWKEKLETQGFVVFYEPVSAQASGEASYVFAFASPWQQRVCCPLISSLMENSPVHAQMLKQYSNIACLDSTHNTSFSATGKEEKAFLYTVVLKNLTTGRGIPAAFMLTPSEAQYVASFHVFSSDMFIIGMQSLTSSGGYAEHAGLNALYG